MSIITHEMWHDKLAEISRLKAELEVSKLHCATLSERYNDLERQLAEARAEVERFKHMAEQNSTEMCEWMEKANEAKSIINDLTGRHGMQTGDMSGNSFEWRTKYTIIERQLAEAKASAAAWQENCRLTEDELERERNKHADTIGKLVERDGAITCYNEVLAELREEVEKLRHQLAERDAKYVATVQSMIDIAATEYAALLDEVETLRHQSINWVSVFDENMILQTQNAALREEVEKIREANRQLAGAAICPDHLKPENVRKQAAQEIVEMMGGWPLSNATLAQCRQSIRQRYGLEG